MTIYYIYAEFQKRFASLQQRRVALTVLLEEQMKAAQDVYNVVDGKIIQFDGLTSHLTNLLSTIDGSRSRLAVTLGFTGGGGGGF